MTRQTTSIHLDANVGHPWTILLFSQELGSEVKAKKTHYKGRLVQNQMELAKYSKYGWF